jgi:hypothetical protein
MSAAVITTLSAQTTAPAAAPNSVTYDTTVTADKVYTGTMEMAVDAGKVTGNLRLTSPTGITGTVAGTEKNGVLTLAFPFHMTEQDCTGTVRVNITLPAKPGPAMGTLEAVGCGREEKDKLTGTVELKPAQPKGHSAGKGGGQ